MTANEHPLVWLGHLPSQCLRGITTQNVLENMTMIIKIFWDNDIQIVFGMSDEFTGSFQFISKMKQQCPSYKHLFDYNYNYNYPHIIELLR